MYTNEYNSKNNTSRQQTNCIIEVMHVLSSRDGWSILESISSEAKDCTAISAELGICISQISKHIKHMRECGLVESMQRNGNRQPFMAKQEILVANDSGTLTLQIHDTNGGRLRIERPTAAGWDEEQRG
jgi:predicted transcriptional regulator